VTPAPWTERPARLLIPLGEFVAGLVDLEPTAGTGEERLTIERLRLELPIEVSLALPRGAAEGLTAGPPTQRLETSVLPVFHRLSVTLERDHERR
jgi:hypothetical protein